MSNLHGVIVGAYPSAPSFHQKGIEEEIAFWKELATNDFINGIEQPYLDSLHPYGTDFILNNIPTEWNIVITAIMETMRRRKDNGAFGLASTNEAGRKACLDYYRGIYKETCQINDKYQRNKIVALQIHSAPDKSNTSIEQATACFYESLKTIQSWDWPCQLIIEHCDSMDGIAPRKAFLPLSKEIEIAKELGLSVCINWARSVLETKDVQTAYQHVLAAYQAGVLKSVMFSGTTASGPYGEWDDLHAPFAPFTGSTVDCTESLMTQALARDIFDAIDVKSLDYTGIKLLEINADADIAHRAAIIHDGVQALKNIL